MRVEKKRLQVCQVMFTSLFAVSKKWLCRLQRCMASESIPTDKHGKRKQRTNKIQEDTVSKTKAHIESFPVKESHYGEKHLKYLDARLTIQKMHEMFCDRHTKWKWRTSFIVLTLGETIICELESHRWMSAACVSYWKQKVKVPQQTRTGYRLRTSWKYMKSEPRNFTRSWKLLLKFVRKTVLWQMCQSILCRICLYITLRYKKFFTSDSCGWTVLVSTILEQTMSAYMFTMKGKVERVRIKYAASFMTI